MLSGWFIVLLVHSVGTKHHLISAERTYCDKSTRQPTDGVEFVEKSGPATLAIACKNEKVDLICCMTGFTRIEWYKLVDNTIWVDFNSAVPSEDRRLTEDNQVASLIWPSYQHAGYYRCVGYSNTNEISNKVRLAVEDCADRHQSPLPIVPDPNNTDQAVTEAVLHENITIKCAGLFGNLKACSAMCDMGWIRLHNSSIDFTVISEDTSERIHRIRDLYGGNNSLMSTLVINDVTEEDFGVYQCWMINEFGETHLNVTVQLKRTDEIVDIYKTLMVACSGVVLLLLGISLVAVSCKHENLRLWRKERRRTEPSTEGLDYDAVLMYATSSPETVSFGRFVFYRLSTNWHSYKPFRVDNVSESFGEGSVFSRLSNAIRRSRCVIVIICPQFIQEAQEELNRFSLLQLLPLRTVVYILFGGIKSIHEQTNLQLGSAIQVSMRHDGRTVAWPCTQDVRLSRESAAEEVMLHMDDNFWMNVESRHKRAVNKFWIHLRLAIPNRNMLGDSEVPTAFAA